ncbi:hypothetical protein BCR43DRAFT_174028 [Syncephalastrum racemosum]|uniref:Uncharacterized protein n=1 Tax=Syncephalastrum racemosum TaxID=13706 RepID=A0A1X2HPK6_SYNRA|nr:hypothetical protein BCR43DRAFT_174028 [Syncephalastrum racemosum]
MNVLATMSARVRPERTVDIGPETSSTPHQIGPARTRIFFRAQEVQTFLAAVQKEVYTVPRTVSSLRRLVSGFEDASTFLVARTAHEEFYAELMMPTMIFTLCNTPHNQGYGTAGGAATPGNNHSSATSAISNALGCPRPGNPSAIWILSLVSSACKVDP